jgi:hypothetical protein
VKEAKAMKILDMLTLPNGGSITANNAQQQRHERAPKEKIMTYSKSTRLLKSLSRMTLLVGVIGAIHVEAENCQPLTVADLTQDYLLTGVSAFQFENTGASQYLKLNAVPNATTGAFTGTISTNAPGDFYGTAPVYAVSGTLAQSSTELSVAFTYSDGVYTYNYKGLIGVGVGCNAFIAGAYTATRYLLGPPIPPSKLPSFESITTGPFPLDAIVIYYISQ